MPTKKRDLNTKNHESLQNFAKQLIKLKKYRKMKITLTGSLGHIGKPLTQNLVEKGHHVTVITSSAKRQKDIEAIGAVAADGSLEGAVFLTTALKNADIVYLMEPPFNLFDKNLDIVSYWVNIGKHYEQEIKDAEVKKVINLR